MSPEEIGPEIAGDRSRRRAKASIKRETFTIKDRVERINSRTRVVHLDNRFLVKEDVRVCTSSDEVRQSFNIDDLPYKNLNCLRHSQLSETRIIINSSCRANPRTLESVKKNHGCDA